MSHIFLINGKKQFGHSSGQLNETLHNIAKTTLLALGHQIREVIIEDGYDIEAQINHFLWADIIIYQMPGWWMGEPWIVKQYIDEVFTAGHGRLYASDGRTRSDANHQYGSGGLLQGKKHMLSLTWNAPQEAFDAPTQFFHGLGIDSVYLHFHKANEFLGTTALPTFLCTDVIKNPNIPEYTRAYQAHLNQLFSQ